MTALPKLTSYVAVTPRAASGWKALRKPRANALAPTTTLRSGSPIDLVPQLGFRPVALAGLLLLGAGSLYVTQVSAGGSYFGDVFLGLLLCGPGVGLTFVTVSIAALAGVPEHQAGLASGLSNTSFQIGAALGVAVVSTVAVSRTTDVLAAGGDQALALTRGSSPPSRPASC
jgi:hypothetical protein